MPPRNATTRDDNPNQPATTPSGDTAATSATAPADQAARAAAGQDEGEQNFYAYPTPEEFEGQPGVDLLMEACSLYGINPDKDAPEVHLLNWRFKAGDRRRRVPDRIVLVTAGGLKIAHPADDDTVERLRHVFRCFKENKAKDGSVSIEILDLPEDLTLPTVHLNGQVPGSGHHVYPRGYLREGGAAESNRRLQARRNAGLPN